MTERQLPEGDEVFLDHVGWFVHDLDAAARALARLGFSVADENVHMNRDAAGGQAPSGTVNRLVTPAIGYLEFLGARGDTPLARQHAAQLARYEGLHLLAFSSRDVPSEAPRLEAGGFEPLPPVDMRREIQTAAGPDEACFSVLRVPPEAMPEGRVQWCGHRTPQHVWREETLTHANGANALTGALWTVEDLDEALARYSRFLRKPARMLGEGVGEIQLDRGRLVFRSAASSTGPVPRGDAVWVRTSDVAAARSTLLENGVRFETVGSAVEISASDALGARLILHEGPPPPFT